MTFDIQKILQSKREFRRGLALLPIEEKLRMLDALRERQMTLREGAPAYRTKPTNPTNEHESRAS
jgi:hypothetical protein